MRHLFTTRIRVLIIVAVLLAAGLAVLSNATGMSIPGMLVQGALAPFRAGANALTSSAEQFYSYMFRYETLAAENEALKAQIAEMEDTARRADATARDNERLRQQMGLLSYNEDYVTTDAYIISWSATDWTSTFTINRGSNVGIAENMCVITANGEVVGLVTEAGPNYAVVKTVLDSTLEISATIASSGYNGMVSGGYEEGRKDLLRMDYLDSSAIIRNNDQVVTSGSTIYPKGLILGHVVDAGFGDTGVAKYAVLDPAAEIGSLEQVFIITQFGSTEQTPQVPQADQPTEPVQAPQSDGVG
ncbi:MAG: rod shape-determining protein MreC [Oscillospiraceae bacterium]|nr:rod shape-determining protein MreC [Oscillospiraceae bacterium]